MMQRQRYVALVVALLYSCAPVLVVAQDTSWLDTVASEILAIATVAVPVLTGLALAFFLWGLVVFLAKTSNDQARTEGKRHMVWGVIGLAILVSTWGIVRVAIALFGLEGGAVPPLPGF